MGKRNEKKKKENNWEKNGKKKWEEEMKKRNEGKNEEKNWEKEMRKRNGKKLKWNEIKEKNEWESKKK